MTERLSQTERKPLHVFRTIVSDLTPNYGSVTFNNLRPLHPDALELTRLALAEAGLVVNTLPNTLIESRDSDGNPTKKIILNEYGIPAISIASAEAYTERTTRVMTVNEVTGKADELHSDTMVERDVALALLGPRNNKSDEITLQFLYGSMSQIRADWPETASAVLSVVAEYYA